MRSRAACCLVLVAALLRASSAASATAATAPASPARTTFAGRPLAEALRSLQREGLAIVFTSRLVTPEMRVAAEPTATTPRRVLDELLTPHGLTAREDSSGVLVVVRAAAVEQPTPIVADAGKTPAHEPLPVVREEIVVRPSRLPLLAPSDASTVAFDRDEIERLPHLAGDLFRAASLLPGIASNDVSAQLGVRGGRRDELKVTLDGQELYVAFHLTDYDGAMSVVSERLLSGATLTTGALPASEGDRMGGVLDLRTQASPTRRELTASISVLDALAAAGGGFADGAGGWRLSARRGSLLFAERAIGDERPSFWDLLGKAELTTRAGAFAVNALAVGDTLEVNHVEQEDVERLENDYRNRYAWLSHQAGNERVLAQTLVSWSRLVHDRFGEAAEEKGEFVLRDVREVRVLGLDQTWSLPRSEHSIEAGWEARRYDATFDYAYAREPLIVIVGPLAPEPPATRRFDGNLRSDYAALWARDVRSWGERLTFETGLRYDRYDEPREDVLSPRLALAWRTGGRSVVRAAWGRFAQSQRPYELAVGDGETRLREAERSQQWVLGYEGSPARVAQAIGNVRIELYHRTVSNPRPRFESLLEALNFFPEIEPGRAFLAPTMSAARGAELLVRGKPGERGSWWLAYTWSRSEDRLDEPSGVGVRRRWVPRSTDQPHALILAASRRLPRQWQLDLAWRWHTGWPTTPVTPLPPAPPEEPEPPEDPDEPPDDPDAFAARSSADDDDEPIVGVFGELASRRFPPYHRLDLRLSRRWSSRWGAFTFFVDVQNAYNRHNLAGFDVTVDDDGMLAFPGEHWPGIVPSLGLAWQLGG